jgi:hypothetical protein
MTAIERLSDQVWFEECSIAYQGRSGLVALLHRLGMEHRAN